MLVDVFSSIVGHHLLLLQATIRPLLRRGHAPHCLGP